MENTTQVVADQATPNAATTETVTPAAVIPEATAAASTQSQTDASQSASAKPIEIELKLPEGSLLKPEIIEQVKSYAKEKNLAPEVAQALIEREHNAVKSYHDSLVSNHENEKAEWVKQSLKDPEIGGERFGQNAELAKRAMEKFGNANFIKLVEDHGFGNHPEVIRFMMNVGKSMAEDKMVQPGSQASSEKSIVELFYGPQN